MTKYVLPSKDKILSWRNFFDICFKEEEHQEQLMHSLVSIMNTLLISKYFDVKPDVNPFVNALEECGLLVKDIKDGGLIGGLGDVEELLAQEAYNFVTDAVSFLREVGILKLPMKLSFDGFVGLNIILEIKEYEEDG